MIAFTPLTNRPRASFVQMYGPPSSVKAEPSSAVRNAYGMKKASPRNISHVNPCAPLLATAPIVSRPTSVQIRKKNMSKRPKCFWSLPFSSSAADVVCSIAPPELAIGSPFESVAVEYRVCAAGIQGW